MLMISIDSAGRQFVYCLVPICLYQHINFSFSFYSMEKLIFGYIPLALRLSEIFNALVFATFQFIPTNVCRGIFIFVDMPSMLLSTIKLFGY